MAGLSDALQEWVEEVFTPRQIEQMLGHGEDYLVRMLRMQVRIGSRNRATGGLQATMGSARSIARSTIDDDDDDDRPLPPPPPAASSNSIVDNGISNHITDYLEDKSKQPRHTYRKRQDYPDPEMASHAEKNRNKKKITLRFNEGTVAAVDEAVAAARNAGNYSDRNLWIERAIEMRLEGKSPK